MTDRERLLKLCIPEPNTGCWLWLGGLTGHGYGQFWANGKTHRAHRWIYEHMNGRIPISENMLDSAAKGRNGMQKFPHLNFWRTAEARKLVPRGERQGNSKLTADQVEQIKAMRAEGVRGSVIAAKFSISTAHVYKLAKGQSWAHLRAALESPPCK